MNGSRIALGLIALAAAHIASAGEAWLQWGGPDRDFVIDGRPLARDWGEKGPRQLWERPLGGGFASIVGDGRQLYATYREKDDEVVIAVNPKNGKTRWEHRLTATVPKSPALSTQYGEGPNSTPLVTDGKIVTLGFTGVVRCLDARKGTLHWSHDLGEEFGVKIPYFGHATSPLAVGDDVVVVAGGLFRFVLDSGEVVWKNREFEGSYGSPRLIEHAGKTQIVSPVSGHLAGFDPQTGKTLWTEEHKNQWGTILTSPVVDESGRVFISAAGAGAILVDPSPKADDGRRLWKTDKTQIAHSNAVRDDEWVYASVGESVSFISATSLTDGVEAWRERGFSQANLLRVGDQFLLLDFDGELALVELTGDGMQVVTRASINDAPTWTPPTLIGTTLFVRDESRLFALDLSTRKRKG